MGRFSVTPETYRRYALAALVFLGVIVVSGAAVRLTGSGLGCSTWPTCEPGSWVPREETTGHTIIEFGNRLFTFAVGASVILALVASRVRVPRRADLTVLSWILVVGVAVQAVMGGITVLVELAPPAVMAHFLLSSVTLVFATILYHRAGEPDGIGDPNDDTRAARSARRLAVSPRLHLLAKVMVVAGGFVLVTGTMVTGSGPHGGDENAERLGFHLPHITQVHTSTVWVLVAASVAATLVAHRQGAPAGLRNTLGVLLVLLVAQGAVGYAQYFTGLPIGLIAVHILGSVLVWVTVLSVLLRTTTTGADAERPLVTAEV